MTHYNIVLELGSQYIRAVSMKDAYIIKEPNLLALDEETKQVKAVGNMAYKLLNSNMANVVLFRPIKNGVPVDSQGVTQILTDLMVKMTGGRLFSNVNVYCVLPLGMSKKDKSTIENVLNQVGVRQSKFLLMPLADSTKVFNEFDTNCGIICNIGGDTTDISAVVNDNIIAGCTLFYGSRQIERDIVQFVLDKYNVKITMQDAEEIKCNCGSLYPNDNSTYITSGVNIQKGTIEEINFSSREIYNTIASINAKYCQVIKSILTSIDTQTSAMLRSEGVFLCGGGAKLTGIDRYFIDVLKFGARIASNPQEVTIKGGQILVKRLLV
ncbi:MAG: rod shape-determining protein [Clostridia bacterium]|nr:rod shape-determining protein [Clostridia bacterium]